MSDEFDFDTADYWLSLAGDPAASDSDYDGDDGDADLEADMARDEAGGW